MRWIFWTFGIFILLVLFGIGGVAVAAYLSFEDLPLVTGVQPLTPDQVERAKQLLDEHDPRKLETGQVGRVTLTEDEIALVITHGLGLLGTGGATARIGQGSLDVQGTLEVPNNPLGRYLNVDAALVGGVGLPDLVRLRVGRVPVPVWIANGLLSRAVKALYADQAARAASEIVREVEFNAGQLRVTYEWEADAAEQLRARLVPQADQERMRAYNDRFVSVARDLIPGVGLDRLLGPLLELASERSAGGDPGAENLSALLVLEAYVNGRNLGTLVPEAREWPSARRTAPTIQGRTDLSQHFMISAVLAATGGGVLADVVGLYKEIDDSRGGSGFSFTDLAADRAGTRFGELCVGSTESAQAVHRAARLGLDNADLMPQALDLPEQMSEAEFGRRYGGTDDPCYRQLADEIERRIGALPLYSS